MKHLLLAIFTIASTVAGTLPDNPYDHLYETTLTSDWVVTALCTGSPLPVNCIMNEWTDTILSWTLTKGRVLTLEDFDLDGPEPTTAAFERCPSGLPNRIPGIVCPGISPSASDVDGLGDSASTTSPTPGPGDSVSTSPSPTPTPGESVSTNPRPTTGESGSTGSPSPTVPTTSESSAPEQSQGAAVGRHMRVAHSIMGGFLAALAILWAGF